MINILGDATVCCREDNFKWGHFLLMVLIEFISTTTTTTRIVLSHAII